jgi:hypothetical protein
MAQPGSQPSLSLENHQEVPVSRRVSAGQALLTALDGLAAYEAGIRPAQLLGGGCRKDLEPEEGLKQALARLETAGEAFDAALVLASRLAQEVRRLGGDPDALCQRAYDRATEFAYS